MSAHQTVWKVAQEFIEPCDVLFVGLESLSLTLTLQCHNFDRFNKKKEPMLEYFTSIQNYHS